MFGAELYLTRLSELSWRKQVAFGILIFERLLPSLTDFAKGTGVDISCYLKGKEAIWAALQGGEDCALYRSMKTDCLASVPDTEDFSHESTSDALNAALIMIGILEFILDLDSRHIVHAANLALDSIGLYLNTLVPASIHGPDFVKRMENHPLMRGELSRQENDLKFLATLPDGFDKEIVALLKRRAAAQPSLIPLPSKN